MALYHKHRPQTFASVIGQDVVTETIKSQIIHDTVAHAYLFSGPRGVGKTTTARLLAKAVNCKRVADDSAEVDPNDPDALEITQGRSMDVIEIDAASHTGVDNVREQIIENARFKPSKLAYKVFIIDEVHMLSTSAFNALLKMLEEPPKHVIFILATTELHKIPDTIISRCQRFRFRRVQSAVMLNHLQSIVKEEAVDVEEAVLKQIVSKSDGCVRDAVSLFEQVMSLGGKKISAEDALLFFPAGQKEAAIAYLEAMVESDAKTAMHQLSVLDNEGISLRHFAQDVLNVLRDVMIVSVESDKERPYAYDDALWTRVQSLASACTADQLVYMIDRAMLRIGMIGQSPIAVLPLELLVMDLSSPCRSRTTGLRQASPEKEITCLPAGTANNKKSVSTPQKRNGLSGVAPDKQETIAVKREDIVVSSVGTVSEEAKTVVAEKVDVVVEEPLPVGEDSVVEEVKEENVASSPPQMQENSAELTLSMVEKVWQAVIAGVEKKSPSLVAILRMTRVGTVLGNKISLHVPFAFHRDKLMEKRCLDLLREMFSQQLAQSDIIVDVELDAAAKPAQQDTPSDLNDIAAAFGGTVLGTA